MTISLENIAKRFGNDWIFRNINQRFEDEGRYAILGHNGSGKSTLMQVLSGHLSPSKGKVLYENDQKSVDIEDVFRHVSYAAPYIDLIEEFTLAESIAFHQKFKPFQTGFDTNTIIEILELPKGSRHKEIRYFSSGMRQRLKIALATLTETPILLLDEPTTNLDAQGVVWYSNIIERYTQNKLLIIASNTEHDYHFCTETIRVTDFK
jgi:ABC-type multidrug transport system ATPase subunit